jgi:hypothetical protein
MKFSKKILIITVLSFTKSFGQTNIPITKNIVNNCIQKDTITTLGTIIRYNKVDDGFKISYQDGSFLRTLDDEYTCTIDEFGMWDEIPKFENETKNYFTLKYVFSTSSGGNPAPIDFSVLIIPKHSFEKILVKDCFIEMKENYVVYLDEENNSKIKILNLESKKNQTIKLRSNPAPIKGITLFIRNVDIKKNKLTISYETLNKKLEEIILVTEEYKLKI